MLASLARPGARVVLAFNNPYSSVVREHIVDYFAHGALGVYSSRLHLLPLWRHAS
jgi:hypothetical protein